MHSPLGVVLGAVGVAVMFMGLVDGKLLEKVRTVVVGGEILVVLAVALVMGEGLIATLVAAVVVAVVVVVVVVVIATLVAVVGVVAVAVVGASEVAVAVPTVTVATLHSCCLCFTTQTSRRTIEVRNSGNPVS